MPQCNAPTNPYVHAAWLGLQQPATSAATAAAAEADGKPAASTCQSEGLMEVLSALGGKGVPFQSPMPHGPLSPPPEQLQWQAQGKLVQQLLLVLLQILTLHLEVSSRPHHSLYQPGTLLGHSS